MVYERLHVNIRRRLYVQVSGDRAIGLAIAANNVPETAILLHMPHRILFEYGCRLDITHYVSLPKGARLTGTR
jgi:hypothetical protein